MIQNVSIPAALIAGLVSFLSPCVLPLVPPYLIYLTGATIEHVANDETRGLAARGDDFGRYVRARLFHRVRGARRQRLPDRRLDPRLVGAACRSLAGIVIIVMGLHFLGLTRIGLLMREGRLPIPEARRALGRLCDGACLCVRLDAVHRADPGRDPLDRGGRGHGRQGCGPARGLFRGARNSVPDRSLHGRAVLLAVLRG